MDLITPDANHAFSRREIRGALITIAALLCIGVAVTPFASVPLVPLPGFMIAFGSAMIVINGLLAAILFSRGAVEHRGNATALASAYLFVALIFFPLLACFPDGLVPGSLIGAPDSAVWLWIAWHAGYVIAVLYYAMVAQSGRLPSATRSICIVVAAVAGLAILCILFVHLLPPITAGHRLFVGRARIAPLLTLALGVYAVFRITTLPNRTPEQLPLVAAMVAACLDMWLTYHGTDRYSLGWYLAKGCGVFSSLVVLASLLHQMNFLYSRAATANGVLQDLARRDGMTGLMNRRGFDEAIGLAWARRRLDRMPLSLIMIDVDHFKRFNDRYGHPAGDDCLRQVAGALLSVTRCPGDAAARYGGEEFAVLLPLSDAYGAVEFARCLRQAVRALAIPHDGSAGGILSVSIGVASVPVAEDGTPAALIVAADRALYRAKAAGRDTICASEDDVLPAVPIATANRLPALVDRAEFADGSCLPPGANQHPGLSILRCEVLEAVASGQPLSRVASVLCSGIERLVPSVACCVLGRNAGAGMIRVAQSGLPDSFLAAMDGLAKDHGFGSCAEAAASGHAVEIHDIASDPLWVPATSIPLAAGLHASWSSPIRSSARVLGILTLFYRTPRAPSTFERDIVDAALQVLALAMAREVEWSQLRESSVRLDGAFGAISQGICIMSGETLVMANTRYSEIYGLNPFALVPGMSAKRLRMLRMDAGSAPKAAADGGAQETAGMAETIVELANGRVIAIQQRILANAESVTTHEDITERRSSASRDALTGRPNRILFEERLQQAIALAARGHHCAVMSLDIDMFKSINDSYGRAAGDCLLQGVADRLDACVREVDTMAHLGSDEFAIVLVGLERPEGAAELAKRIAQVMIEPFDVGDASIEITVSIGIAIAPDDGTSPGKLLRCADAALSRAKADERGTYRYFEEDMDARLQQKVEFERDLRAALCRNQFELVYQPLFDLANDEICGFEALLRWRHPVRGLVSPADFIPLAEETGIIVPLGAWVLDQACAEAVTWPKPVTVAVNLSGVQIKHGGLVAVVKRALASSGLPAARLELEITESVLVTTSAETLGTLHSLRDLGLSIAMDDFGTGYSSLSYLRSFPFTKIKIDQTFIRDIAEREDSIAIIRTIVGLGHSMGMITTAEGVETTMQLDQLRNEGCNEVQGYLLSRPVTAAAVHQMLASDTGHPALAAHKTDRAA